MYKRQRFGIPAISTGEMFRAECKAGTELGKMACTILSAGGLVSDEIVDRIVAGRIARPDCARGFLLDGYPRTAPQAQTFAALLRERGLPDPVVVHLDVPDSVLMTRLTARRQCPRCKHIYNLISQPPQTAGRCDADGAELITREDDREQVIRERLHAYQEQTGPILKYYSAGLVHKVDAAATPDHVAKEIEQAIAQLV